MFEDLERVHGPLLEWRETLAVPFTEGPETDGLTLYRVLARHVYGDPRHYDFVLDATIDHFLRVWVNSEHPLHQEYHKLESSHDDKKTPGLCELLMQPSMGFEHDRLSQVLRIIADAHACFLRVQEVPALINNSALNLREPDLKESRRPVRAFNHGCPIFWEGGP
ncbi:hypothetical protein LTR66_011964, partial [Elasticomyces elasticus]